jgi:hypothetical protein
MCLGCKNVIDHENTIDKAMLGVIGAGIAFLCEDMPQRQLSSSQKFYGIALW